MLGEVKNLLLKSHTVLLIIFGSILSATLLAVIFFCGIEYERSTLSSQGTIVPKEIVEKSITPDGQNKSPVITVPDGEKLENHNPKKYFPTFNSIQPLEDMDTYLVVYRKSKDIRQVVIKDKNTGEIFCYECHRMDDGDEYELTHSFIRKNPIVSKDKDMGM